MTDTATTAVETSSAPGVGRIARVTGPVVDIEFPHDAIPEMYNLLFTTITIGDSSQEIGLEVAQHLGDDLVRAISLKPTDGLVRGQEVRDSGAPISVPVGDVTKGKVFDVLGNVLNTDEKLEITERWPIHRKAPAFDQLESKTSMFETGIKSIDLLTPYVQGGKIARSTLRPHAHQHTQTAQRTEPGLRSLCGCATPSCLTTANKAAASPGTHSSL